MNTVLVSTSQQYVCEDEKYTYQHLLFIHKIVMYILFIIEVKLTYNKMHHFKCSIQVMSIYYIPLQGVFSQGAT